MYGLIGRGYEVKRDLYDIAERIKEIDPDYFIFYSYAKKRYEVHSKTQKGNTLALVVPYDKLDERTLTLVRRTRVERIDEVMEEQRKENERMTRLKIKKATEKGANMLESALSAI